ncbi:sugar phosphate nucleotidyltransferase [uncultured Fusobacterium sp.]|uniref:nucleotidyltransferase family protein n=1 Tax=uncultured Fusobacterium sp. TaxID=159267 RepID=UPI0025F6F2FC|nr:sugar phosphate nucleotidyltransferase [uncultured Fusobacterium sp.]
MTKISLVIMAAGIGSRFGGGIKQLEPVGPNGEIIMDYSIYDAIKSGFNKIIFIIRKDIEEDFKEVIGNRIEKICKKLNVKVHYAYQELDNIPSDFKVPKDRKKPWGTGHAVLSCKDIIREPFVVINADDYYGKDSFKNMYEFLSKNNNEFCMAGFKLKNTLSDNGGVTRGICQIDKNDYLTEIIETSNITKIGEKSVVKDREIDINSNVSMNMWGLSPEFINTLEQGFIKFLEKEVNNIKSEYLLPIFIGELLKENRIKVKVLETKDKWFGVTYKEDKELVKNSFKELIERREYQENLFEDILN